MNLIPVDILRHELLISDIICQSLLFTRVTPPWLSQTTHSALNMLLKYNILIFILSLFISTPKMIIYFFLLLKEK